MFELLSLLGIGVNLVNDAHIHNQKYFGTEREIQRNNPEVLRNRKACEEIGEKIKLEKFFGVQRPLDVRTDEWLQHLREMKAQWEKENGRNIPI